MPCPPGKCLPGILLLVCGILFSDMLAQVDGTWTLREERVVCDCGPTWPTQNVTALKRVWVDGVGRRQQAASDDSALILTTSSGAYEANCTALWEGQR